MSDFGVVSAKKKKTSISLDAASVDQLSDTFLQMNIRDDPALVLQYKMLAFVYKKDYLKYVHLARIWQEFIVEHTDIGLTGMELKIEFCINIMADIDKYEYLSVGQKKYFKLRIFNKNADELLRNCDLEPGVDFVDATKSPSLVPFETLQSRPVRNFFGKNKTRPIPVSGVDVKKAATQEPRKDRPLIELVGLVFQTPLERQMGIKLSGAEIQKRIQTGISQKIDFNELLQQYFREVEHPVGTAASDPHHTPGQSSVDQTLDSNVSHVPRSVTRASSQPGSRTRDGTPVTARPVSADRSGENLRQFAGRMKARSKPRRRI